MNKAISVPLTKLICTCKPNGELVFFKEHLEDIKPKSKGKKN